MRRSDFAFELPPSQIAQYPATERTGSRLLVLNGAQESWEDGTFREVAKFLRAGDLLVFNDTRVVPARLLGRKETGGKLELLLERIVGPRLALCQIGASRKPQPGTGLVLEEEITATIQAQRGELYEVHFCADQDVASLFQTYGRIPLPPYIARSPTREDAIRYQTVYAREAGAVAAPTAGLHFDKALLETLRRRGINTGFITLHIGLDTFRPVRCEDIDKHVMHTEHLQVSATLCQQVRAAQDGGGRVVAVGTTVVRALETAACQGRIQPFKGDTHLYITPGYSFRVIDALITNFHLAESTLLMLVCAFGGYRRVMAAYQHAVQSGYRFFSYGDAMLVFPERAAWTHS
jgi:S-adenosylmethionine:tRNA ribosyltransferase-isomerase